MVWKSGTPEPQTRRLWHELRRVDPCLCVCDRESRNLRECDRRNPPLSTQQYKAVIKA